MNKKRESMFNKILSFGTVLIFILCFGLNSTDVFAQGRQEGRDGRSGIVNRDSGSHNRGSRHYYHNGNWNRNGWYGWGIPGPIMGDGVLVASLPPGYTTVVVGGNPYFYGNGMYFRQMPAGGFAVVTLTN